MGYEFSDLSTGVFEDDLKALENDLISRAVELRDVDLGAANEILMETLTQDIRCIDAHAHLGNFAFDLFPELAFEHYKVGVALGDLSLPRGFTGLLLWTHLGNRPYLRALHGLGLCLWRLERFSEAQAVFERLLSFNPPDNQGARDCWEAVSRGEPWSE